MNSNLKFVIFITFIFAIICGSYGFTMLGVNTFGAESFFNVTMVLVRIMIAINVIVIIGSAIYIIKRMLDLKKEKNSI